MTDDDVLRLQQWVRNVAAHWAKRWAWRQDTRTMVDDLESVGWVVLCTYGPAHPRLRWEMQNAMQDEISNWLYGVRRGKEPRVLREQTELDLLKSSDLSPLDAMLLRDEWQRWTPRQQALAEKYVWPRSGREYRMLSQYAMELAGAPRPKQLPRGRAFVFGHHVGRKKKSLSLSGAVHETGDACFRFPESEFGHGSPAVVPDLAPGRDLSPGKEH